MNDIELLQYVHETAEMGIEGLNSLDGQVRDDSLRRVLSCGGFLHPLRRSALQAF